MPLQLPSLHCAAVLLVKIHGVPLDPQPVGVQTPVMVTCHPNAVAAAVGWERIVVCHQIAQMPELGQGRTWDSDSETHHVFWLLVVMVMV